MKLVEQKDPFGCAVACTASIAEIEYKEALSFFENGEEKAREQGFYCREIVKALDKIGLEYSFKKIGKTNSRHLVNTGAIVFIGYSQKYPLGHYLLRLQEGWMDPWINFPEREIQAGLRKRLPGKPIYLISAVIS